MTHRRRIWRTLACPLLLLLLTSHAVANRIQVESSDESGVTLTLEVADFGVQTIPDGSSSYQLVEYGSLHHLSQTGEPMIPVSRIVLGVPLGAGVQIQILESPTEIRPNVTLAPNPTIDVERLPNGAETTTSRHVPSGEAYRTGARYPTSLVAINTDGMVRSQRVIQVELRPVQYEHRTRRLFLHPKLRVRVLFTGNRAAPAMGSTLPDSTAFEQALQSTLLNYQDARRWREPRPRVMAAPSTAMPSEARCKVLIEQAGLYRLGYDLLKATWGESVDTTDPRKWHLSRNGEALPVYVQGERDGRFDPDDYLVFYAPKPTNIYSRWDAYWLSVGNVPGVRAVETDGLASSAISRFVNSFRERLHFEEDELHHVLNQVRPASGEMNEWFEKHDHWFWTGVRNRGEKNETQLEFPLYGVADTIEKPWIRVQLQGGTPVDHHALPMINDIRIANAQWSDQETWEGELVLPAHSLLDATQGLNRLTLTRVDVNDEEDSKKYPYHVYINSFDVEYTRLLHAVGGELQFSSPISDESYDVRKRRRLEYTLHHFLNPDIEVFELDGDRLTARVQGVSVEPYELDLTARERIRRIREVQGKPVNPVPRTGYRALFQQLDTHNAQFIAVSSDGFKEPARLELVQPSTLRDRSNGADYIVISSPRFFDAAQRLVDWRSQTVGGGYRTALVSTEDIYNEFHGGTLAPKAIKDFLRYAYQNWQAPAPTYVVLMGDGTFDFHGVDTLLYPEPPELMGYIPTHYIWTTFGQTAVDHWYTTISGIDALPDFYLGRIPIESLDEANVVVDKLIEYDSNPPNGKWRRKIISVADDDVTNPSDFIFKKSLNEISQNHALLGYETVKIFLEDITDAVEANPAAYDNRLPGQVAREIILEELGKGSVLTQYAGHGGPHVWAHEIIFDNRSIELLQENPMLPFVLVLSCYNGYFDAPVKDEDNLPIPSMAEAFLRQPRAGAIAMYSATRLTFGTGNDLLNRIVFDLIFRRDVRQLGSIVFSSKLTQLLDGGLGELDVMQAYTLFGDPATVLAMTDYDFVPEIPEPSVAPGQTLRIASGQVMQAHYNAQKDAKEYTPANGFSGSLEVIARYANGVEQQETLTIQGGRYPEVTFTVPDGVPDGRGTVEFYAENHTQIAMGGAVFSVRVPRIKETVEDVTGSELSVAVQVADNLRDAGLARVAIDWRDPIERDWQMVDMVRDPSRGAGWYSTQTPLPIPETGQALKYRIMVWDTEGNNIASETQEYQAVVLPDFRILRSQETGKPLISYEYIADWGGWGIRIEAKNVTLLPVNQSVRVAAYEGNPDLDGDAVVDEAAVLLGETTISPDDWRLLDPLNPEPLPKDSKMPRAQQEDPLGVYQAAVVFIPSTLPSGTYPLFAWIDPDDSEPRGAHREALDSNNLEGLNIAVEASRVGETSAQLESLDGVLSLQLPAQAFAQPGIVTVEAGLAETVPSSLGQAMLTPVDLAAAPAYHVRLSSGDSHLQQPVSLRLRIDIPTIRDQIKAQLGLEDVDDAQLTPEQDESISFAAQELVQSMAGYVWSDELGKWIRLPSKAALDASGKLLQQTLAVDITSQNHGEMNIVDVATDPALTPEANWVVFFTDASTYRLYRSQDDELLRPILEDVSVHEFWTDPPVVNGEQGLGIQFAITLQTPAFGDVLKLRTVEHTSDERNVSTTGAITSNRGNGVIHSLSVSPDAPTDEWCLLFLDATHFQIEGRQTGLLSESGAPIIGEVGTPFLHADTGMELRVLAGTAAFVPGDRFRFRTEAVGLIQSEINLLGTVQVMSSTDVEEPSVRIRVAGQDFADGDPVATNPTLQAILSDDNGIDVITRPLEVALSTNDGAYELVSEEEAQLSYQPGGNQVVWNWMPTLDPGRYALRVLAHDVDGLSNTAEIEFLVNQTLELTALNHPNPFERDTTIACELTVPVDELEIRVYSIAGRLIRVFREYGVVGFVPIHWDGLNDDGDPIANGVYYGKVTAKREGDSNRTVELKMMKLR